MINKILALIALSFLISGCTQLTNIPPGATSPGDSSSTAVGGQDTPLADTDSSESPRQVIAVGVTEETGSDLSTIILDSDIPPSTGEDSAVDLSGMPGNTAAEDLQIAQLEAQQRSVLALCREIGNKLGSVTVDDCLAQSLVFGGAYTVQSRPIAVRDFLPESSSEDKPRILIMGGIHGDEYSSISIMFKWMEQLENSKNRDFHWRFAPSVNPDGLLDGQAVRQNANGVDLNRNFPSDDWLDLAQEYWANTTSRNPRRYPGSHPASEPEVQWVVEQINSYKPDVIVSVHAPYHLLDYDGPPEPPERIGELHLHLLGVYPGSLGNYAGLNLGIPVVTMELPSAGIMPADEQITKMWKDLLDWLYEHHES